MTSDSTLPWFLLLSDSESGLQINVLETSIALQHNRNFLFVHTLFPPPPPNSGLTSPSD